MTNDRWRWSAAATWARRCSAACSSAAWVAAGAGRRRRGRPPTGATCWRRCSPASRSRTRVPRVHAAVIAVKPPDVAGGRAPRRQPRGRSRLLSIAAGVSDRDASRARPATASPSCGRCRTRRRSSGKARRRSPAAGRHRRRPRLGGGDPRRGRHRGPVPEQQLDAVTGLAGSGPGVPVPRRRGADRGRRRRPVCAATGGRGAGRAAASSARRRCCRTRRPGALRAMVTSPGGTTAAGLRVLEERHAFAPTFVEAVVAAHANAAGSSAGLTAQCMKRPR